MPKRLALLQISLFSFLFLLLSGIVASAQVDSTTPPTTTADTEIVQQPLTAEAGQDKNVVVGRNVLFDASGSTGPTDKTLTYTWDFGDGQQFQGIDASHIYAQPGTYKAKLTLIDGTNTSRDTVLVSVAQDVVLLITDDASLDRDKLKYYRDFAQRSGTLLVTVKAKHDSNLDYVLSRNIAEQLIASTDDLIQAKVIVVLTQGNVGLDALAEVGRILSTSGTVTSSNISFSQKAIIRLDDKPASQAVARVAQNTFNTVVPNYILLTTTPAFETVLSNPSVDTITDQLKNKHTDYQLIGLHSERALDQITPFNFFSYAINYLINHGVSQDTIFLLLILPVVATIISFGRQVIGVKAFGIYVPSMMTLTFIVTELKYGLLIFLVLLITATLTRIAVRRLRLLYLPRMAIVLTIVSFSIFVMLLSAQTIHLPGLLSLSIFPVLVMIMLTEKFVDAQIEQGSKGAIILTIETLLLAIISYEIVTWDVFETFILAYPEAIILTLAINIVLGRFSGLRVVEYFRFHKLLKTPKP